jgi:hypothetical protein
VSRLHSFRQTPFRRQSGAYDVTPDDVTLDEKKFLINVADLKEGSEPLALVLHWTADLKKSRTAEQRLPFDHPISHH